MSVLEEEVVELQALVGGEAVQRAGSRLGLDGVADVLSIFIIL